MIEGPHIVARSPVTRSISWRSTCASARRTGFSTAAMKSSTLTCVGLVLVSAMRIPPSALRASRSASRPPLPLAQALAPPAEPLRPRLSLLRGLHPADPFVARQRGDVLPRRQRLPIARQRVPQLVRKVMHDPARDALVFGHRPRSTWPF